METDTNDAEVLTQAAVYVQLIENLFCVFFSGELLIRFCAFAKKKDAFQGAWFLFDTLLVFSMVVETWILAILALVLQSGELWPLPGPMDMEPNGAVENDIKM